MLGAGVGGDGATTTVDDTTTTDSGRKIRRITKMKGKTKKVLLPISQLKYAFTKKAPYTVNSFVNYFNETTEMWLFEVFPERPKLNQVYYPTLGDLQASGVQGIPNQRATVDHYDGTYLPDSGNRLIYDFDINYHQVPKVEDTEEEIDRTNNKENEEYANAKKPSAQKRKHQYQSPSPRKRATPSPVKLPRRNEDDDVDFRFLNDKDEEDDSFHARRRQRSPRKPPVRRDDEEESEDEEGEDPQEVGRPSRYRPPREKEESPRKPGHGKGRRGDHDGEEDAHGGTRPTTNRPRQQDINQVGSAGSHILNLHKSKSSLHVAVNKFVEERLEATFRAAAVATFDQVTDGLFVAMDDLIDASLQCSRRSAALSSPSGRGSHQRRSEMINLNRSKQDLLTTVNQLVENYVNVSELDTATLVSDDRRFVQNIFHAANALVSATLASSSSRSMWALSSPLKTIMTANTMSSSNRVSRGTVPQAQEESDLDEDEDVETPQKSTKGKSNRKRPSDYSSASSNSEDDDDDVEEKDVPTRNVNDKKRPYYASSSEDDQENVHTTPVANNGTKKKRKSGTEDPAMSSPAPTTQELQSPTASEKKRRHRRSQKKLYQGRRKWTDTEKTAIKEGIQEFGVGEWTKIKEQYYIVLQFRTSGQIKDCYRTMLKKGEIQEQPKRQQQGQQENSDYEAANTTATDTGAEDNTTGVEDNTTTGNNTGASDVSV